MTEKSKKEKKRSHKINVEDFKLKLLMSKNDKKMKLQNTCSKYYSISSWKDDFTKKRRKKKMPFMFTQNLLTENSVQIYGSEMTILWHPTEGR